MSKPYDHAILSAKKWGGVAEDYLPIHDFMDSSKAHVADMRHRALLHSSFGIFLAERVFGTNITVKIRDLTTQCFKVSVRDIAEQHVIQDLGFIPSVQQYLDHMELAEWMGGKKKKSFKIVLKAQVENKLSPETVEALRKATANGTTLDQRSTSCYVGDAAEVEKATAARLEKDAEKVETAEALKDLWGESSKQWKDRTFGVKTQAEKDIEAAEEAEDFWQWREKNLGV